MNFSISSKGIYIIPNTSKTEKEILQFNYELGSNLPFISENGAAINGLELLNADLPKELILSREKYDLLNIFKNIVPINLQNKCKWVSEMNKKKQSLVFGLEDKKLKMALNRKYTIPFVFEGTKSQRNELSKIIKNEGLYNFYNKIRAEGWQLRGVIEPLEQIFNTGNNNLYAYRFDWDDERNLFIADFQSIIGASHALEIAFVSGDFKFLGKKK